MNIQEILPRLKGVRGTGGQYSACCPSHDDKRASLRISEGAGGKILLHCHAGCNVDNICKAINITRSDLFCDARLRTGQKQAYNTTQKAAQTQTAPSFSGKKNGTCFSNGKNGKNAPSDNVYYEYTDLEGKPILRKTRTPDKRFFWEHYDNGGNLQKGRNGVFPPLFMWQFAKDRKEVFIVEGEKDAFTLAAFGKVAVSLADGAKSKWRNEYSDFFRGKDVVIIPDNDNAGREYAEFITGNLQGIAESIKVIDLREIWQGILEHADITDYYERFGQIQPILELIDNAKVITPPKPKTPFMSLTDVQERDTSWLWYPYIPRGKITLLSADPGTGKTFFSLYLTACVSTGTPFWGEAPDITREPSKVIYQTAEDGYADTIKPRLTPMKPNFSNIHFIDETEKGLTLTDGVIEETLQRLRPSLIIFDPLQAYLGATVDMHSANEVRPIMSRIGHLAEAYNCAVIFIMHNNKNAKGQALYRTLGSIDIPAVARSMLIMANNPEEKGQKLICHEKSSLAMHGKSIAFRIAPERGGVIFEGFSDKTANDVLNREYIERESVRDNIKIELLDAMGEKGAIKLSDVEALKKAYGWSDSSLKRAKSDLRIKSITFGFDIKTTWWLLPEVDTEEFKERIKTSEKLFSDIEKTGNSP